MSTVKQKILARKIVDSLKTGVELTGGQMLEEAGYGKGVAKSPKRAIESKGVKEELKNLGFSVDGADSVIEELLYGGKKEETKIKAAQEVYKRLGAYPHGGGGGGNTYNTLIIADEQRARIIRRAADRLSGGAPTPDRLHDSDQPPV